MPLLIEVRIFCAWLVLDRVNPELLHIKLLIWFLRAQIQRALLRLLSPKKQRNQLKDALPKLCGNLDILKTILEQCSLVR